MIFINTIIQIVDNTGGRICACIKIVKRKKAKLGDKILVSLRRIRPNLKLRKLKRKLEKGQLWTAFVLKDKNPIFRIGAHFVRYQQTGLLLFKNISDMAGSRIYGPVNQELYNKKYFAICNFVV